jgi:hypothetical protein
MNMQEQISATFRATRPFFQKPEKGDCRKEREYRDEKFPVKMVEIIRLQPVKKIFEFPAKQHNSLLPENQFSRIISMIAINPLRNFFQKRIQKPTWLDIKPCIGFPSMISPAQNPIELVTKRASDQLQNSREVIAILSYVYLWGNIPISHLLLPVDRIGVGKKAEMASGTQSPEQKIDQSRRQKNNLPGIEESQRSGV